MNIQCILIEKQAGTGPSRRHIQGSKIAKRLPSVKYSFTVLKNRNFLKKNFSKKSHTQKNGPTGALKTHNAEKLKGWTLWGFSTFILPQNMKKLKKTKIFIFGKKSHNAEKKLKGGTLWDFLTSILSQNIKKMQGGPFGEKISLAVPKKMKGGVFGLARYGMLRGKTGKTFLVQFARPNSAFWCNNIL